MSIELVTPELIAEEGSIQIKIHKVLRKEEEEWRLKSRALWLPTGNRNTTYFHKQCKARRGASQIKRINIGDNATLSSFEDIKKEAFDHYATLYSESGVVNRVAEDQALSYLPQLVIAEDNAELTRRVSEEEIMGAIRHFGPYKASGPDGFSAHFYQKYWHVIKFDLSQMVQYVQKFGRMGGAINSAFLALIPKEINSSSFSRFHPISLCNVSYKIISKIIATKIQKLLPNLISPQQGRLCR
jgi:hypothetical protein